MTDEKSSKKGNIFLNLILVFAILVSVLIGSVPLLAGMGGRHPNEGDTGLFLRTLPLLMMGVTFMVYFSVMTNKKQRSPYGFLGKLAMIFYAELFISYFIMLKALPIIQNG